jgi:hypothetical protein
MTEAHPEIIIVSAIVRTRKSITAARGRLLSLIS